MKKLLKLVAFVCLALPAFAQNLATVSASNIQDLNGAKLAAGQLCFLGTDNNDNPISFQVGGGGQVLKRGYCSAVAAGVVASFTVPNPANTSPTGIYYRVTVKDSSTGVEVLRYTGVTFSGGTFSFDTYTPNIAGASFSPLSGTSVTGNLGVNGNVAATGTVTGSNIPGNILQQIFSSGVGQTQRTAANFTAGIQCADNAGTQRTDCRLGTFTTVTFSATPTFDASTASSFKITLTANVTSSTLSGAVAGEPINIEVCQDATGGRTFVPPTNVAGWVTIPSAATACLMQDLVYDGTNAVASTAGTVEFASPPPIGSTTPNTGAFTTLTATSIPTPGPIGGTTPSTGAFTSVRINGGTAYTSQTGTGSSVASSTGNAELLFVCRGVATASSTLALDFGTCTGTTGLDIPVSAGTLANLRCSANAGGVNASSGVVSIRKNTVNQTMTCTFGTATTCSDTAHPITMAAGDRVGMVFTTQVAETLNQVSCSIEKQ